MKLTLISRQAVSSKCSWQNHRRLPLVASARLSKAAITVDFAAEYASRVVLPAEIAASFACA